MALKEGEKYLTVKILGNITVSAFKKRDRKETDPHYVGNGIAVWINKKRTDPKVEEEDI